MIGEIVSHMFVLLVGPKGSRKSYIGRKLERSLGVLFFHVEPLWIEYYTECEASGRRPSIAEAIAKLHPRINETLRTHENICVEATGASPKILNELLTLAPRSETLVIRVSALFELGMERIAMRDQTNQVPMDVESIREVYELSVAADFQSDFILESTALSEAEIVSRFKNALVLPSRISAPPDQATQRYAESPLLTILSLRTKQAFVLTRHPSLMSVHECRREML